MQRSRAVYYIKLQAEIFI